MVQMMLISHCLSIACVSTLLLASHAAAQYYEPSAPMAPERPAPDYETPVTEAPAEVTEEEQLAGILTTEARFAIVDKRTAHKEEVTLKAGTTLAYEHIEMAMLRCWKENTPVYPEHAALVDIYEPRRKTEKLLFSGWLFKNKSELSNLEHPQYDVMLLQCVDAPEEEKEQEQGDSSLRSE